MLWRLTAGFCLFAACLSAGAGLAADSDSDLKSRPATGQNKAATLRADYERLKPQLQRNQFGRPIYLQSTESSNQLDGGIYARVDYPLSTLSAALKDPAQWCDVLILHINIKYCRAARDGKGPGLVVRLGKKDFEALDRAHRLDFAYQLTSATPDYFEAGLRADNGPFSTRDYRIVLTAIPLSATQSFLHLTYSYGFGALGHMAMQGYVSTTGRNKVGFTIVGEQTDGRPQYIGGVRGVIERNTMRYFLAIDAYLAGLALPATQRLDRRLKHWFAATEQYALQLHEINADAYMDMKQREYERQRQVPP